jgi:hypothetical protein
MFSYVKQLDRTRVLRRALELTFKGKRHIGRPRTRWFSQELGDIKSGRTVVRERRHFAH